MNLLKETLAVMRENGKSKADVRWFGTKGKCEIPLEQFGEALNVDYDDGYGGTEIDMDLVVVGDDWWLERHEYDGSEWWEYKTIPQKPKKKMENVSVKERWHL